MPIKKRIRIYTLNSYNMFTNKRDQYDPNTVLFDHPNINHVLIGFSDGNKQINQSSDSRAALQELREYCNDNLEEVHKAATVCPTFKKLLRLEDSSDPTVWYNRNIQAEIQNTITKHMQNKGLIPNDNISGPKIEIGEKKWI